MVLEYVPGESLYQLVKHPRGGPLRVPDAARYFQKVVDGLEAAHDAGLVHRDIKPSNLMVTPEGDARILDLGLARLMDEESPLTRPNVVIGTLDYYTPAPKQLGNAARRPTAGATPLQPPGCTICTSALAGRAPVPEGETSSTSIFKQLHGRPRTARSGVAPGGPLGLLAAVVRKLMAKDPDDRYQDCEELRGDLARWADPAVVHSILGSEADSARAFRPPPPELDEDDLRLLSDEEGISGSSLRDLGSAEAPPAPMHKPPRPPRPAVVLRSQKRAAYSGPPDETRWLVQFIAFALIAGVLVIVAVAIFQWRS